MCKAQLDISRVSIDTDILHVWDMCCVTLWQWFWMFQLWSHSLYLLVASEIFPLKYPLLFWHNWSYTRYITIIYLCIITFITPRKVAENSHNILFYTQSTSKLKELLLFLLWEWESQIQNAVFTAYLWCDMCIIVYSSTRAVYFYKLYCSLA